MNGVTFSAPSGIQLGTQSGIPQTVDPYSTGTFLISVSVPNSTQPGEYNVSATALFAEICGANTNTGQIGFTLQVIAQEGPIGHGGIQYWWVVIAVILIIASAVVVVLRRRDEN